MGFKNQSTEENLKREKQIEGLEKAISIWEKRADGTADGTVCPLCIAYKKCKDCPIADAGHEDCLQTPYRAFMDHDCGCFFNSCEKHEELAQKEVDFLKRILKGVENGS